MVLNKAHKRKPHKMAYHASAFSMTSVLTNASRHSCMSTLLFLVDGIGKDRYMKLLYVVDVCKDKNKDLCQLHHR